MFRLDNLTRVSIASFSRYISALGGVGGPEKDQNVRLVPKGLMWLWWGCWFLLQYSSLESRLQLPLALLWWHLESLLPPLQAYSMQMALSWIPLLGINICSLVHIP